MLRLLRLTTPCMISAKLILATGSRAGTEAPLMVGYYMIGRDRECQIRPKSRSVSRRHCIVHHSGQSVRLLDLESTSGTQVNGERILPKTWVDIDDGDLLKFGKICFKLQVSELDAVEDEPSTSETMLSGDAWKTFDVANFLASADEEDQEQRYREIRSKNSGSDSEDSLSETVVSNGVEDLPQASRQVEIGEPDPNRVNQAAAAKPKNAPKRETSSPRDVGKRSRQRTWSVGLPNLRLWSGPSQWFAAGADGDRGRLLVAVILTLALLGVGSWQVYRFTSGPEVRVLKEID
ncbi:FHA domain-containing protein [Rubripirellula amarantea]|nr:FHA domain-containing protein [Rubripirellula amarantea]